MDTNHTEACISGLAVAIIGLITAFVKRKRDVRKINRAHKKEIEDLKPKAGPGN